MKQWKFIGFGALTALASGMMLSLALTGPGNEAHAAEPLQYANAPCTDSEGSTTGFFCQPVSSKGTLIKACDKKKPKDLAACQAQVVTSYCQSRSFGQSISFSVDAKGNLAEVVCTRQAQAFASAPPQKMNSTTSADDENWQPLYNANIWLHGLREFKVADRNDWRSCKAACDADKACKAWTQVPNFDTCYLKDSGDPNLISADPCCITGIKGMASAGDATEQKRKMKTPEELRRLGRRTKDAAEDEVGRRVEDKVRRGLGGILGN